MLTKRTSDLTGLVALVFKKTECQGISGVITLGGFILGLVILSLVVLSLVILSLVILSPIRLGVIIFFVCSLRNWSAFLWSRRGVADFGFTNKDRAGFNGNRACLDVTNHLGAAFDFNSLSAGNITVNFTIDND